MKPSSMVVRTLALTFLAAVSLAAVSLAAGTALAAAPYVGQADIHDGLIVFTAENDLWTCDRQGQNVPDEPQQGEYGKWHTV